MNGSHTKKDISESAKWYASAAVQGQLDAQCAMARCYVAGLGVSSDTTKAKAWFLLAAEQGDPRKAGGECVVSGIYLTKAQMQKCYDYITELRTKMRPSGYGPTPDERLNTAGKMFRDMFVSQSSFIPVELKVTFTKECGNKVSSVSFGKAEFRHGGMILREDDFEFLDNTECRLDGTDCYQSVDGRWNEVQFRTKQ